MSPGLRPDAHHHDVSWQALLLEVNHHRFYLLTLDVVPHNISVKLHLNVCLFKQALVKGLA